MHPINWLKSRGNPVEWAETEKAFFAGTVEMGLYFCFFCIATCAEYLPALQQHTNLEVVRFTGKFSLVIMALWGLVLLFTLHVRRKNPDSTLPSIIKTYLVGQPLMVMAVLNGVPAIVTGLLLSAVPIFGMILFNSRHVLIATGMIWVELTLIGIAVSLGYLPDAPIYINHESTPVFSLVWFVGQILIGLPAVGMGLFIVNALLKGLRSREEKILTLSCRDGLTGVWNRRYLTEMLEHEIAVSRRSTSPLSVVMIDLDFFKKINDEHGRAMCDKVLILTAATLQQAIRETDYIGRFGDEEFVVVLPACDEKTAMTIAERCRSMIEALTVKMEGARIPVSASFGVSTTGDNSTLDSSSLLNSADKALYQAKHAGRNRVVFTSTRPHPPKRLIAFFSKNTPGTEHHHDRME